MPLTSLGFNLLEASPHVNPCSSRSCAPLVVGVGLAPRPSPRPKPSNQLLSPDFSVRLPQHHAPDCRDFPSRESVLLLMVLPTVQSRSSFRFSRPQAILPKQPITRRPLGPICNSIALAEAMTTSSQKHREMLRLALLAPCGVCLAAHNVATAEPNVRR